MNTPTTSKGSISLCSHLTIIPTLLCPQILLFQLEFQGQSSKSLPCRYPQHLFLSHAQSHIIPSLFSTFSPGKTELPSDRSLRLTGSHMKFLWSFIFPTLLNDCFKPPFLFPPLQNLLPNSQSWLMIVLTISLRKQNNQGPSTNTPPINISVSFYHNELNGQVSS